MKSSLPSDLHDHIEVSLIITHCLQRIAEIIKRKNKQRLAKAAARAKKEAAGDFSHLKNKKGELIAQPLPQPTLPNVSLDDEDDSSSRRGAGYPAQGDFYGKEYGLDYPPMPAYNQPPYGVGPDAGAAYHHYNPSLGTLPDDGPGGHYDESEYGSTAHLTLDAPGPGGANDIFAPRPMHGAQVQDPNQLYAYRGPSPAPGAAAAQRGPSPVSSYGHELAYDDPTQYQPHPQHAQYQQQQQQQQQQYQYQEYQEYAQSQHPQQHHGQQQHQQEDAYGYGYPSNDHQRGNSPHDAYEYDAGPAHAL